MTPEDRQKLRDRVFELAVPTQGEAVAGALLLLGDRLVGSLDGILSALRAIEEHLGNIVEKTP